MVALPAWVEKVAHQAYRGYWQPVRQLKMENMEHMEKTELMASTEKTEQLISNKE